MFPFANQLARAPHRCQTKQPTDTTASRAATINSVARQLARSTVHVNADFVASLASSWQPTGPAQCSLRRYGRGCRCRRLRARQCLFVFASFNFCGSHARVRGAREFGVKWSSVFVCVIVYGSACAFRGVCVRCRRKLSVFATVGWKLAK